MRPLGLLVLAVALPVMGIGCGVGDWPVGTGDVARRVSEGTPGLPHTPGLAVGRFVPVPAQPPRVARAKVRTTQPAAAEPWATDWPTFRGPQRDGCSPARGLLPSWPEAGPACAWTNRDLGRGYSGPAVVGQRVYILGTAGDSCTAFALDVTTGQTLWKTSLGPNYANAWGPGPRSTPTVDGPHVYCLTPQGQLACLRTTDGSLVWKCSLEEDLGGEAPFWGYSESPLIDGDRLVVTPGYTHTLAALDKKTGRILWQSTGCDDGAQYTSLCIAQIGGQKCYLTMADRGLIGFFAHDGRLAFRYERTKNGTAHCTMPLVVGDQVYTTSGFHGGCGLVRLTATGESIAAQELYTSSLMKNQHGGVVLARGHVFGYSDGAGWVCQNLASGALAWQDDQSLPKGAISAADGRLYLTSEQDGTTVLLEPSETGWQEQGRLRLPETTRFDRLKGGVWTHPVIAAGKLFVRDQEVIHAFDVRGR